MSAPDFGFISVLHENSCLLILLGRLMAVERAPGGHGLPGRAELLTRHPAGWGLAFLLTAAGGVACRFLDTLSLGNKHFSPCTAALFK